VCARVHVTVSVCVSVCVCVRVYVYAQMHGCGHMIHTHNCTCGHNLTVD